MKTQWFPPLAKQSDLPDLAEIAREMAPTSGTPMTLTQAIINGLYDSSPDVRSNVELAVKDFVRQILCIQFLKYGDNQEIMNVLYEIEAKLGCRANELEAKRISKRLDQIIGAAK